jgi:hypothetical protein
MDLDLTFISKFRIHLLMRIRIRILSLLVEKAKKVYFAFKKAHGRCRYEVLDNLLFMTVNSRFLLFYFPSKMSESYTRIGFRP